MAGLPVNKVTAPFNVLEELFNKLYGFISGILARTGGYEQSALLPITDK